MSADAGVLYVNTGRPHVEAALRSAKSLRFLHPNLPCAIFRDPESASLDGRLSEVFNYIFDVENAHRRSKVDYLYRSPYGRTLYLDSDTRVSADISGVFRLLDNFDISLAHAHARNRTLTQETGEIRIPDAFPQFNSGVIAFRNTPEVIELLKTWQQKFHSMDFRKDQVSLREILWQTKLRVATLPPEFNVRYWKYALLWGRHEAKIRIKHYRIYGNKAFSYLC